jgi:hypothetical protein
LLAATTQITTIENARNSHRRFFISEAPSSTSGPFDALEALPKRGELIFCSSFDWYWRHQCFLPSRGYANTGRPFSSECRSIQPFAIMLATVCLPDGWSFSMGSPLVALIRWRALLSDECGMWLGRAGIFVLGCSQGQRPQTNVVSLDRDGF